MKKIPKLWMILIVIIILVSGLFTTCYRSGIGNLLTGETGIWGESTFGDKRFGR